MSCQNKFKNRESTIMGKEKTVGIGSVVKQCQVFEKQLRYWQ
jgi:hypothetical protein